MRPTEVDALQGDARKAARELEWTPRTNYAELARIMVEADCRAAQREVLACSI
jgi:GDPmannose 4,6-dehydratase